MGVSAHKKPPLPAPTESSTLPTSGDEIPNEVATDISRRTDRTSATIPEDGSPITLSTSKKGDKVLGRTGHGSQTSLLIEYFEGGKGPNVSSRPSVRVKVTPSSGRKGKDAKDHVQITESSGTRKPSYTRRISLPPRNTGEAHVIEGDAKSISSLAEESNLSVSRPPVEIEVMQRGQGSDLSNTSQENRYTTINPSEISSMPPDSMLEGNASRVTPKRSRSRSLTRTALASTAAAVGAAAVIDTLKTPTRQNSRSPSRERLTKKVIEKLGRDPPLSSGKHKHGSKSRSRSVSKEHLSESAGSPRRRSGKHHRVEDLPSEPSVLTESQLSGQSYRSDTSKYSVTNPKLLAAVEDSIRRLILPELNALKAEQKTKKNLDQFEKESITSVASSTKEEDSLRRISKHSSDPSVRRSKHGEHDGSLKKKRSKHHDKYEDSPSERSFEQGMSQETVIHDASHKHRKRSKEGSKLKEAALGAAVGGLLTHAALKHHDSSSSIDRKERRRRQSKSHSRSHSVASAAETEDIFNKHDVPPMPMRSELTISDVTRDSILSERTSTPSSEHRRAEIRHVARASPKQLLSPGVRTPTLPSPSGLRNSATYDDPEYYDEYSQHSVESYNSSPRREEHHYGKAALTGAAVGAGLAAANHGFGSHGGLAESRYVHGKSLSPIQSVASFEEHGDMSRKSSQRQGHGADTTIHEPGIKEIRSKQSLESANFHDRSSRPKGVSLESGSEILLGHEIKEEERRLSHDPTNESWFEGDDQADYRDSIGADSYDSSRVPVGRLTQYTDDSMDAPYLDKVTAAQQVRSGAQGDAEWVHTPLAVESAVASLHEPSILESTKSGRSYLEESHVNSPMSEGHHEFSRKDYEINRSVGSSPLKQEYRADTRETSKDVHDQQIESPRQSPPQSIKDRDSYVPVMTGSALPNPDDPLPEIMHVDSKSEISTNPPDIQGPKKWDTPTQWPFHQPTPPMSKAEQLSRSNDNSAHESLKGAAAKMLSVAAGAGAAAALAQSRKGNASFEQEGAGILAKEDVMASNDYHGGLATNDNAGLGYDREFKDEGYETTVPNRSPGLLTPDHRHKNKAPVLFPDPTFGMANEMQDDEDDDPFMGGNAKRMSGNSHGMMSPLYDSATGEGKDRIQSKDIIALMDHLTVRDAQRNARDTEILVTLVRSAAEMRNSFEDMKRFIRIQDDMLIAVGNKQHEKTQRVIIGGPRPQPPRTPRRMASGEESMIEDLPSKRRNVFRRALKGLSGKNSNELQKIEEMLEHLLEEVADLKAGQEIKAPTSLSRGPGLTSYEHLRDAPQDFQDGYEPEGQAGTSSTPNQSGYFSNPPSGRNSRQQGQDRRRTSQNRISTVLEEHEEDADAPLEPHEQNVLEYENTEHMLTPTRERMRGNSVPTETTETANVAQMPKSSENTPRTDKSRKHKSSSSSFFPKISRWSKTTASTVPDLPRNSGQHARPYSGISHSGSDLQNYELYEHYDPQGDDRIRSNNSIENVRPPSPLIPSHVSGVSEDPQYQAHRNSLILQHPQPRQGTTARHQNHLESQVHDFSSPISPASDHFGSNPILARYGGGGAGNRNSASANAATLSPIPDRAGYSEVSTTRKSSGPPRPPKIKDDGPLIPPKIPLEEKQPSFVERSAAAREFNQSNGASLSPPSGKKPGGPRPITSSGSYSPEKAAQVQKKRYRGSPNAVDLDDEDDETF